MGVAALPVFAVLLTVRDAAALVRFVLEPEVRFDLTVFLSAAIGRPFLYLKKGATVQITPMAKIHGFLQRRNHKGYIALHKDKVKVFLRRTITHRNYSPFGEKMDKNALCR